MVVLTSFTQPTDGIRHRQNNTTVYVNDNNIGKGTLFIAESCLSWVSDSGNGFSLEYPHISLHAVSRDLSAFPQECLFLMLDTALGDEETNNGNGEHDNGEESGSDEETTELRLVPDDRGMLDAMFHAMNVCQALHPDPEDSFSDEDFYEDADDEIPMEETDYRMAGLRIESTDGRPCIGRGVAAAVDMEEDTEEDRVVGMGEGILRTLGGRVEDRGVGMSGIWGVAAGDSTLVGEDKAAGDSTLVEDKAAGDSISVGAVGSQGVAPLEWGKVAAAVGSQGVAPLEWGKVAAAVGSQGVVPLEWGRVAAAGGSQGEAPLEWGRVAAAGGSQAVGGRAVGRVGGMVGDTSGTSEGRVGGTLGTSEGRVVDMVGDTLGTSGGRVVDMVGDRVVGTLGTAEAADMGRHGRPLSSGSIWHQGRPALPPPAHSPHTVPQHYHNFDDAEN